MMTEKNRALLVAPLPPPDHDGICNWSRILRQNFADSAEWSLHFIDIQARYREVTNHSRLARLTGGTLHAFNILKSVYREIKRFRPQVIHLCTSGGLVGPRDVLTLKIARLFGVPSLIHYRMGRIPQIFRDKSREWRWTVAAMKLADAVLTLDVRSEACVREFLPNSRVITLPNMVEIDVLDAVCAASGTACEVPRGFHVTFAGQILPAKGVAELVEAAAKFADRGLQLNLIGPVSEWFLETLRTKASAAGSTEWFHHHGPKPHDETIRMMFASDLIALPSYTEGFPNVIAEAMALGKPILATAVGAIPEMLDIGGPEECGVVVPPGEVELLAAALDRLLADSPFRLEIGQKARRRAMRLYAAPVACRQLADLWASVKKTF
jgi:glycosyltransferase involved in cell wall biosynthesis